MLNCFNPLTFGEVVAMVICFLIPLLFRLCFNPLTFGVVVAMYNGFGVTQGDDWFQSPTGIRGYCYLGCVRGGMGRDGFQSPTGIRGYCYPILASTGRQACEFQSPTGIRGYCYGGKYK